MPIHHLAAHHLYAVAWAHPMLCVVINAHDAHHPYGVAWRWMLMMRAISRCGMGTLRVVV